jgi:hypothetical protein
MKTDYPLPPEAQVRLRLRAWLNRVEPLLDLSAHPDQWANALMDSENKVETAARILTCFTGHEDIDRGIDKAIIHLQGKGKINRVIVSGISIRNLYYLHAGDKRHDLHHQLQTLAFLMYVLMAWEWTTIYGTAGEGMPIYFGGKDG